VRATGEIYPGRVLDFSSIDLEEIANALPGTQIPPCLSPVNAVTGAL
jgi:hypothetical protein